MGMQAWTKKGLYTFSNPYGSTVTLFDGWTAFGVSVKSCNNHTPTVLYEYCLFSTLSLAFALRRSGEPRNNTLHAQRALSSQIKIHVTYIYISVTASSDCRKNFLVLLHLVSPCSLAQVYNYLNTDTPHL